MKPYKNSLSTPVIDVLVKTHLWSSVKEEFALLVKSGMFTFLGEHGFAGNEKNVCCFGQVI